MTHDTSHPWSLRVSDVMSTPVRTVQMDDSLATVKSVLDRHGCHHIVVMGNGRVRGIVSDRDILRTVSPFLGNDLMERRQDVNTLQRRAHQIMSRSPVTIGPNEPVAVAANTMLNQRVSCLPVVDRDGALVGIVTSRDILKWSVAACPTDPSQTNRVEGAVQ